jgi:hypothetical protein
VINALTDYSHPCQAMADAMTAMEIFGRNLAGMKIAFIGDGNNVARSLAVLCARLNMEFVLACPKGYELDAEFVAKLPALGGGRYSQTCDAHSAVKDASVLYTDTWASMGQEQEKAKRVAQFQGFQIDREQIKQVFLNILLNAIEATPENGVITARTRTLPRSLCTWTTPAASFPWIRIQSRYPGRSRSTTTNMPLLIISMENPVARRSYLTSSPRRASPRRATTSSCRAM